MKTVTLWLIRLYRYSLALFSIGSCRYYPSCSEYARWQIENRPYLLALLFSLLRILRCNSLFQGGIDYPEIYLRIPPKPTTSGFTELDRLKYWLVPKSKGSRRYYVIRCLDKKTI